MARTTGSDGYVTLAVLLIVGLLAAIVSGLLSVSRPALGLARIGGDEVAAEALLQGGIATAGYLLFTAERTAERVDGQELRLRTGDIRLSVADEAGRIDLNAAEPILLAGLFSAAGGNSMSGQAFGARVVDWRDDDGDVSEGGAEANDYAAAELGYAPADLPFHSVEELRLLLGLSPRDFERLAPHLTVFTGKAKVDPVFASVTVLRAIPGLRQRDIERLLRARDSELDRGTIVASIPAAVDYLLEEPSGVYRIGVEVELANRFGDAAEAVVVAPQEEDSDYRVVAWTKLASPASQ